MLNPALLMLGLFQYRQCLTMPRRYHLFNQADKGRMSNLSNYLFLIALLKRRTRHHFATPILSLTHKLDHNLLHSINSKPTQAIRSPLN
jgi:hypothetical protein